VIRLTWRQARPALASCAVVLALLAVTAVVVERSMASYIGSSGLGACVVSGGECPQFEQLHQKYGLFFGLYPWLNFVPMFLGAFWGGPLIAREIEQGTHRLVWAQSVTRRRWLATKLGVFLAGAFAAAAIATWIMTFWLHPVTGLGGEYSRLTVNVYDFVGIVPIGYTLFAFAFGAAAGAVTRRTLPAMAITIPVFLALRLGFQAIRGRLITPVTAYFPLGAGGGRVPRDAWVLDQNIVDAGGRAVQFSVKPGSPGCWSDIATGTCVPTGNLRSVVTYQPGSRFWELQGIEFGVFAGATVLCLVVAMAWTLRRVA
jgi:ABC-type transport system involved in multi-copper enzyme maturation permease subunit